MGEKYNKIINTPSKDLAYILGVLCSDGYVQIHSSIKNPKIGLSVVDKEFRDYFKTIFDRLFNVSSYTTWYNSDNPNHSIVYSCNYYDANITMQIGNFYGDSWHRTIEQKYKWVLGDEYFYNFLSGFFDGDGSIKNPDKWYSLRLHIGYEEPFFWIKKILVDKGYDFTEEYRSDREDNRVVKQLVLGKIIQIKEMAKKIRSSIPRKEMRLEKYRKAIISYPSYYDDIENVFALVKQVREKTGFGPKKLARHEKLRKYDIPDTTIRNWLWRDTVPKLRLSSRSNRINIQI